MIIAIFGISIAGIALANNSPKEDNVPKNGFTVSSLVTDALVGSNFKQGLTQDSQVTNSLWFNSLFFTSQTDPSLWLE
jgi:hypothetical protein